MRQCGRVVCQVGDAARIENQAVGFDRDAVAVVVGQNDGVIKHQGGGGAKGYVVLGLNFGAADDQGQLR